MNDACESTAIETVFGADGAQLSISSSKGVAGHCLALQVPSKASFYRG